ncbi:MAG: T9SS type A sorting domain-containing protein [Cyclobacteriaceae bacterium]
MKFLIAWSFVLICFQLHSQCPGNINSATTIPLGTTCTYSGPETQGFLASVTLTIPETSTLIINDDYTIYDDLVIDGRVEVYGDFTVAAATASVTISESGTLYVNGNYYNGLLGIAGTTTVNGTTEITGTYYNHLLSTTNVGTNATKQFNNYDGTLGGTLNVPAGDEGCEDLGCCGGGCASLPIQLLNFSATERDENALIEWKTGSEIDNDYFEIQKATFSDPAFATIGTIERNGSTADTQRYSFVDEDFQEDSYYRLVQFDFDGRSETFKMKTLIKSIYTNEQDDIHIYPNPSPGNITISGASFTGYQMFDHTGKLICAESQTTPQVAQQNINQVLQTRKGTFFLVFNDQNQIYDKRLIKQ